MLQMSFSTGNGTAADDITNIKDGVRSRENGGPNASAYRGDGQGQEMSVDDIKQ